VEHAELVAPGVAHDEPVGLAGRGASMIGRGGRELGEWLVGLPGLEPGTSSLSGIERVFRTALLVVDLRPDAPLVTIGGPPQTGAMCPECAPRLARRPAEGVRRWLRRLPHPPGVVREAKRKGTEWQLSPGFRVVVFFQVYPEVKTRQIKRWADGVEAALRDQARAGSDQASGDDGAPSPR
jgi:hypothetical protein